MEDEKINIQYENNVYKFKILYLIRTNLPKSEYTYIITFFIKYIGLILFSISLNEWNTNKTNENFNNNETEESTLFNIQNFFANLIITGHHFKLLASFYEIICFLVFCFFVIYCFCIIYVMYLIKLKYQ